MSTPKPIETFTQDPDAKLDYKFGWEDWLSVNGTDDTIATSTFIKLGPGTLLNESHDASSTTVWIEDGVAGQSTLITNRIVTTEGRADDRTIKIVFKER